MTILLNGKKKPLIDKWNNPKYQSFAANAYHHAEHVSACLLPHSIPTDTGKAKIIR